MNNHIKDCHVMMLENWKEHKKQQAKEQVLQEYYQLLDFGQLINESKQLRKKLAKGEAIIDMSMHTKLIFDEIQKRMIGQEHKDVVKAFINMN